MGKGLQAKKNVIPYQKRIGDSKAQRQEKEKKGKEAQWIASIKLT